MPNLKKLKENLDELKKLIVEDFFDFAKYLEREHVQQLLRSSLGEYLKTKGSFEEFGYLTGWMDEFGIQAPEIQKANAAVYDVMEKGPKHLSEIDIHTFVTLLSEELGELMNNPFTLAAIYARLTNENFHTLAHEFYDWVKTNRSQYFYGSLEALGIFERKEV